MTDRKTMTARALFDLEPLGALIEFSDGTTRPPERHKNKLRDWLGRNNVGYFIAKHVGDPAKSWDDDTFTLQTQNGRVLVVNRIVMVKDDDRSTYTVTPPAPGTILAYSDFAGRIEIRHVWPDLNAARDWATGGHNNYKFATCGHKYFLVGADGSLIPDYMPED